MNSLRSSPLLFAATLMITLFFALSSAAAFSVVALDIDFDEEVDPRLQDELDGELIDIFDQSSRYNWLPADRGINRVDTDLIGCFEEECLREIGTTLGAHVGLVVDFTVESEMYEWTITFYDLSTGEQLATEENTCALCGRAEVVSQFRTSLQSHLTLLNIDRDHPAGPIESSVEVPDGFTQVRITTIPTDTRIFLDEEPIGEGEAIVELDEGSYDVRFSHDTHHGLREQVIVTEDGAPLFILRVHLRDAGGEHRQVITRGDGVIDRIEPHRNTIGWTAVGIGAGLTVASFFLARRHGQPTCHSDIDVRQCPDVYNTSGIATMTTIVGTTGLAGGAALLVWPLLAGKQQKPTEAGIEVAPAVGREFTGFSLHGRF